MSTYFLEGIVTSGPNIFLIYTSTSLPSAKESSNFVDLTAFRVYLSMFGDATASKIL